MCVLVLRGSTAVANDEKETAGCREAVMRRADGPLINCMDGCCT